MRLDETDLPSVPLPVLAHALRTPLNVVEGYAALLAGGGVGRLDDAARAAVAEVHAAARSLGRTLDLVDRVAEAVPPPARAVASMELWPLVDRVAADFGWRPSAREGAVAVVAWPGLEPLLRVSLAALDERGTVSLGVAVGAMPGRLDLTAAPYDVGSGDTVLADWLADRLAASCALDLARPGPGRLSWSGAFGATDDATRAWRR